MIVVINKNNILHNYYSIYNKNIFNKMIIIVDIRITLIFTNNSRLVDMCHIFIQISNEIYANLILIFN